MRKNKGITLIALVVTIVVLIILATISIYAVLGENGLIAKTQQGRELHEQEKVREDVTLILSEYRIERQMKGTGLLELLQQKQAEGKLEEVTDNGDETITVIKDGYEITIDANTLEIIDIGKAGLRPKVSNIKITTDGTTEAEDGKVKQKTPLIITFTHSIEGGTTTVTPSLPYTTDGEETKVKFVVTGTVDGEPYTRNVIVDVSKKYVNYPPAGTVLDEKPNGWTSSQVTPIADGEGGVLPLPKDFYYVGGDINEGIVISDKQGDTIDAEGVDMGNQFVWIPVASEADLERTNFDSNGQPTTGLDTSVYTEPYANGYSTEASEYNTMKQQVLKYGGFYIGRFEAGINSTKLRTAATTAQTVVSKKKVAPYNEVPWGKAMNNASEEEGKSGAVYLAKNMYQNHPTINSVTSTLCYGCQWDAMCRYIGDSERTTTKKSAPELTGSVSTDVSKNIYDLAGNCYEWTMESRGAYYRSFRGGVSENSTLPVYYREGDYPSNISRYRAFRCTLYVK